MVFEQTKFFAYVLGLSELHIKILVVVYVCLFDKQELSVKTCVKAKTDSCEKLWVFSIVKQISNTRTPKEYKMREYY